jgi:long-chain acyl-CoA synthetase
MPTDLPHHTTVVHMLAAAAARAPQAEALVCGDVRLTYVQYARCVSGYARELQARGARGARVALLVANSVEAAIMSFAIQAAGAVFCPMNPAYTARELVDMLADAGCTIAVCDDAAAATLGDQAVALKLDVVRVGTDSAAFAARWAEDWAQALDDLLPDAATLGMIQYTGGTTGRSKGVMLTHAAVAANVRQREALLPTEPGDRFLCMMPLFHSFAMAMNLYQAVWCAGALVILPRYRPDWVLDILVRERITVLPAGATVYIGLLGFDGFATTDFSRLRICYSGASALPAEILRRWQEATGCAIYEGYGQTEAGPILTYNSPLFPVKPGKVGKVLPDTEVQIVDVETGTKVLPVGESGEIRARGPQLMLGYWNRPEETAATLRDGWLYTSDIGAIDDDGYLAIQDRKKDMVITGGYNVYPREVDDVLLTHPAVHEAATFGVPDSYRGEIVRSHVVLRAGTSATVDDLLAHCRANLAKYKVPAALAVVDALPKTSVGKIDKKALRAALS